jgi:hypothetical membrane protein
MNTHNFVVFSGIMSVLLAIYCGIPYLRSILSGRTKPHQFSWLIFAIMNAIVALSQYLKGARASVLISLTFLVFNLLILALSFKYGTRNTSKADRLLLGLSLLTIVAWIVTKNPSVAIWLTVIIDIFATAMIVLKIKSHPSSEAPFAWVVGTLAYVFSCLSLVDKKPGILYVRPIYGVLSDVAILAAIYLYKSSKKSPALRTSSVVE